MNNSANSPIIWFAGTPIFAAVALRALLLDEKYSVQLILTQPDRPAGRGRKLQASAVKNVAEEFSLPILQPEKIPQNPDDFLPQIAEFMRPDLVIVAAYGLLLPQWFLDYPRLGCVNIHASLLPRWRGAAPIQRAIEAGDKQTGISIMQMEAGLDTGAVWRRDAVDIANLDSIALHDLLADLGGKSLLAALPEIFTSERRPEPQNEQFFTYAAKLSKAEAQIDWKQEAEVIARKIRAFALAPVAYAMLNSEPVRIYAASVTDKTANCPAGTVISHDKNAVYVACGSGQVIALHSLQFAGKKRLTAAEIRNSRDLTGANFS
ncbi:MAG: methionyl-tRNA formyltransferase [Cardiobacteriaceae bacterium]|nr:methionyl-tRNA formyltransferase [Cardiobacteriaceae bacterium]